MESVIEKLKEFNQSFAKADKLNEVKKTVKYINISDKEDSYTDLNVMFTKKLNLANYKKVTIIESQKIDLIQQISNSKFLTESDIEIIKLFLNNAEKLVTKKDEYSTEYNKLMNKKSLLNKDPEKNKQAIQDTENKLTELKKKYNKI